MSVVIEASDALKNSKSLKNLLCVCKSFMGLIQYSFFGIAYTRYW
jgi:hypothetical protein